MKEANEINVGKGRYLINESVSSGDEEMDSLLYVGRLFGRGYFRETARTVITSGALQGNWNHEASLRRLDDIDKAENLERAFLEGNRIELEKLRRLS